jgi:hypothetical protein
VELLEVRDLDPRLLPKLAPGSLVQALALASGVRDLDEAAGKRPRSFEWVFSTFNEKQKERRPSSVVGCGESEHNAIDRQGGPGVCIAEGHRVLKTRSIL